ncbi:tRNA (adenosine(37)-N6)-dimethylallyltransferase MiaA [uncultured Acetobacteroides sp.]|uniref:tRNA (adenosine(37)-N6)-dimethylallyltransferase MiaA n=1 Tax=uncultured Acetobacteroides sp. TaxID=1760811 RepID=UPI0029F4D370|nr:tRNA (adenosine(37)-N6)-dimethylallyltransferase MiaA [uncultured Acetobacteroides sp.]
MGKKTLVVLMGPTAVGKTDLSISIAKALNAPIVSSDSRQIYKEMRIGTAVPEPEQLAAVPHYFIGSRSIHEPYTAGRYEFDAVEVIEKLFLDVDYVVLSGGSGLYIDAVCLGIDAIPATNSETREMLKQRLKNEGIAALTDWLKRLDENSYNTIDLNNHQRVIRALEVCIIAGVPYSTLRKNFEKTRNFDIVKIGLQRDREELYQRINQRVDMMMEQGLLEEARSLYEHRELNALNTVGYRELFDYFDGKITMEEAVELIKRNSRRYAKRQITWFNRYCDIAWFSPNDFDGIMAHVAAARKA